jgi:hypothetical protein
MVPREFVLSSTGFDKRAILSDTILIPFLAAVVVVIKESGSF